MTDNQFSENKWTTVPPIKRDNNVKKYRPITDNKNDGILTRNNYGLTNHQITNKNVNISNDVEFPIPIRHYWSGFDINSGVEKWYIEFDNGNLISNDSKEYGDLVKKFFTI